MEGHYYHHDNHLKRHKYVKRARWFGWGALISLILLIIALVLYVFFFVTPETPPATSTPQHKSISAGYSVFPTPYYQFQTSDGWIEIENEDPNKFEYRSEQGSVIQQDLTIYVNPTQRTINGLAAKHILVVEPEGSRLHVASPISEPCGELSEGVRDNDIVTHEGASFKCIAGGALFDALVGVKDGSTLINYQNANGETVNLYIYFRDLRSDPDGGELTSIVESFQLRTD